MSPWGGSVSHAQGDDMDEVNQAHQWTRGVDESQRSTGWLAGGVFALLLGLTGCAYAPGGHIDYETEAPDIDHLVDIQAITPALVANFRQNVTGDVASTMPSYLKAQLTDYEYRVGPGDVLNITVYDHPELTIPGGAERSPEETGKTVQPDGRIYFPYVGRFRVAGRTVDQIRRTLTGMLSNYITEPQVDVNVAAYHSKKIYVSGAVATPGAQPITTVPLTLVDAVSQAGGPSETANWHEVVLNRDGTREVLSLYALMRHGDQTQNRLLRDGDVVHIPTLESENVAVLGQVRNPGNLVLGNERITLTTALARAGGVIETTAEPSGIFVIRPKPPGDAKLATVYQLDISNATSLTMGTHFPLQPQDVVYVTAAPLARWNNVISLLLPSALLPGTIADTTTRIGEI